MPPVNIQNLKLQPERTCVNSSKNGNMPIYIMFSVPAIDLDLPDVNLKTLFQ